MILKDGKFWDNGNVVPMEHGNKKQIELLSAVNEAIDEGIPPQIIVQKKVSLEFKCVACGHYVQFEDIEPMDEDDMIEDVIHGETGECYNCKVKYVVINDDLNGIMVKIKTKKK